MANVFVTSTSVWKVEDTGTLQTSATDAIVQLAQFFGSATMDDLIIHTGQDKEAFALKCNSNNKSAQPVVFDPPRRFKGLKVKTIDGGTGYLYLVRT